MITSGARHYIVTTSGVRAGAVVRAWTFAALVLAAVAQTSAAYAQGTARSMDIDASVRSSGMGGASDAVFWGGDPNFWANPALLGYHEGLRYLWSRTKLVPGLADDVIFTTHRGTAGWGGIGLAAGVIRLNYGQSVAVDPSGNPTGTFESHETIAVQALGVSASRLVTAVAGVRGAPRVLDYADVAVGWARKDVDVVLAPIDGGASGVTHDWGMLVRISPMPQGLASQTAGVFLDLAYAHAVLNYDDTRFLFANSAPAPATRSHRNGFAARSGFLRVPGQEPGSWVARGFEPLAVVGFALDQEHNAGGDLDPGYDVERWGVEATLFNVTTLRIGHVTDRSGDIDGGTFGFGFGLPFGDFAGVRYDYATIPQATSSDLPDVRRHAVTAWIDPIRMAAALSHRPAWASTSAPAAAGSRSGSPGAALRP